MSQRPAIRRLAVVLSLFVLAALFVALPVTPLVGKHKATAQAAVAAGDVVYQRDYTGIYQFHASDSSSTQLSDDASDSQPDVSPDGSRIVFVSDRGTDYGLWVMNADGTSLTQITTRIQSEDDLGGTTPMGYAVYNPRWSADGQWIVYAKYSTATGLWKIKKVTPDGLSDDTILSSTAGKYYPTWSPNGNQIAYSVNESGLEQIRIVDADGSGNNDHRITASRGSYNDDQPSWSPDGSRIYVSSDSAGGSGGIAYFTYTGSGDPFSSTSVTRSNLTTESGSGSDSAPRVSADGSTVYFHTHGNGSASYDIAKVSSSGGTVTRLTTTTWDHALQNPSPVGAAWSIKHIAVLGDSYSAGEAVSPYISPSDTDGCHRSEKAYAEVLDSHPDGLLLTNGGFVACSGATTGDVINGKNGEDPQVNAISGSEDYVIFTAGGNDIGFVDYVTACVVSNCAEGSSAYTTAEQNIQNVLPDNLATLFSSVAGRVGNGERVLVLGYPMVLPLPDASWGCSGVSSSEQSAARQIEIDLNAAISAAVTTAGAPFEFVDADANLNNLRISPFAGHEMCSEDSYFGSFTYHPNDKGHTAYAKLVTDYLATHPNGKNDFVTNGSFESGSTFGWNATNNPSVSSSVAHSGSKSMTFTGSFDVTDSPNSISSSQPVDVDPVDFWAKGPSGKTIRVKLRQYLSGGNNELYQSFTLDGNWDHFTTDSLHLYPGYSLDLNFDNPGAGSSDVFYLDDIHEYAYPATETCGYDNLLNGLNADAVENCGGEAPYGTQFWAAADSANPTLTSDTADAHDGSYSFKLVAANSGTMSMNDSPDARDTGEVSTSATSCTATAWMKGPSTAGSRVLKLRIREYNANQGGLMGTATGTATPNGSWQQLSVARTLASGHDGNTHLDLYAYMTNASANDVVRVDHITETCS